MENVLYGLAYLFDVENEDGTLFYFFDTEEERNDKYSIVYDLVNKYFKGDIDLVLKKFTFTLNENISKEEFMSEALHDTNKKEIQAVIETLPKIKSF
jgi:hypothetical protein